MKDGREPGAEESRRKRTPLEMGLDPDGPGTPLAGGTLCEPPSFEKRPPSFLDLDVPAWIP